MNIVPFHESYLQNVGRIKSIDGDSMIVSINAGRKLTSMSGSMEFPTKSCLNFVPQVDDRVLLCVDDDAEVHGYIFQKLSKRKI